MGEKGRDDDNNGIIDDAAPIPSQNRFEPGYPGSDDENLSSPQYQDWPKSWVPISVKGVFSPIEAEAIQKAEERMQAAEERSKPQKGKGIGEDAFKSLDWAAPGKQHRSGKYDD